MRERVRRYRGVLCCARGASVPAVQGRAGSLPEREPIAPQIRSCPWKHETPPAPEIASPGEAGEGGEGG